MTREEAFYILGVTEEDEVEDAFDDLVFNINQFFVSKVPFTKLFNAKLDRLRRFFEAKEVFVPQLSEHVLEFDYSIELPGELKRVEKIFSLFGRNEMEIKLLLVKSKTIDEYTFYVTKLIENYKQNADCWKAGIDSSIDVGNVKMSVEPDVMKVYEEIKRFNSKGLSIFSEINQLENDNLLKQEAIRLSLWSKFEEND